MSVVQRDYIERLLEPKVEAGSIDERYGHELRRLACLASTSPEDGTGIVAT